MSDSLVNLVVNYTTVRNTDEQCRDPISRAHFPVPGPEERNEAIKLAGSVCGYCRQHNLSKRSVQLERFGDGKRRSLFLKFGIIEVAKVTSDGSSARDSKFATLNPCHPMLMIRILFAFQLGMATPSRRIYTLHIIHFVY